MTDDHTDFPSESPAQAPQRRPNPEAPRHRPHEPRAGERHPAHRSANRGAPDRQAVLVDARFWAWLHEDEHAGGSPEAARDELLALVQQQGHRLTRLLWFTDQDAGSGVAGVQVRRMPSNAQDRGVTMLRAMAQELHAMAEHRSVERVLLVTDDDRLLLAVDEAQRLGLQVDMLVDGDSKDLKALQNDDPNWACLLQAADRRVVLGAADAQGRGQRQRGGPRSESRNEPRGEFRHDDPVGREGPTAEASGIIESEILAWWDEEPAEQRAHWRHEVQDSRGIPQELDRQLLLRISRRLGQHLSHPEKTAMRLQVREQILSSAATATAAVDEPSVTTPPADA